MSGSQTGKTKQCLSQEMTEEVKFMCLCVFCASLCPLPGVVCCFFKQVSESLCAVIFLLSCYLTCCYDGVKSWVLPVPKRWSLVHCGRMTHSPGRQDCRRSKVVLPLWLWPAPGKDLCHSWNSDQLTPEKGKEPIRVRVTERLYNNALVSLLQFTFASPIYLLESHAQILVWDV